MSARFLSRVLPEWGDGEPGGRDGWRRAGCAAGPAAGRRHPGPLREELGRGRQSQPPPPGSGAQCCRAPVTPGAHGRLRSCPRSSASKRGPLIVQLSDRWRNYGGTKLACHSAVKIPVKLRRGGRGVTHSTHPHPDAAPSLHTPALLHGLDSDGNVRNRAHRRIFHLQSELAGDRRDGRADRSLGLQASGRRGAGGGWGAVLGRPRAECVCFVLTPRPWPRQAGTTCRRGHRRGRSRSRDGSRPLGNAWVFLACRCVLVHSRLL